MATETEIFNKWIKKDSDLIPANVLNAIKEALYSNSVGCKACNNPYGINESGYCYSCWEKVVENVKEYLKQINTGG